MVLVFGEQDALTYNACARVGGRRHAKIMAHKLDLFTPWSARAAVHLAEGLARRRDGMLEVLVTAAARAGLVELLQQRAAVGVGAAKAGDVALDAEGERTGGGAARGRSA